MKTKTKQILEIGKSTDGRQVKVDLPRLVDTRLLLQANSGGGKSWLLRLLAERAAGQVQMIILDPEGEFATLRERVDIALIGSGGEIATDVRSAGMLARKLVELKMSAIVDLYELKLGDRRRYVRLFLEALLAVPRALWHPLLLMLDEAHLFVPERSAGEAESTEAVISLMSQGRKRGFCGILSTQRLSKLHKDAAAESNNVMIGRTWLDIDQQRAGDLLGMNKQDRQRLRDLDPGEFFGFGPALSRSGVIRFRSDTVQTTHPKAGERHLMEVPEASAAIQQIVKQLSDLPRRAEEEQRTIENLLRENGQLKQQLRTRPIQTETRVETKTIEVPILRNGQVDQLLGAVKSLGDIGGQILQISSDIRQAVVEATQRSRPVPVRAPVRLTHPSGQRPAPVAIGTVAGNVQLSRPEQAILDALATFQALGLETVAKANVAVWAHQSPTSSGFTNNLGRLRSLDLITYPMKGQVMLTDNGQEIAHADLHLQTVTDLHQAWFAKLSRPQGAILAQLIERYPHALDKRDLAELAGQSSTSSGYTNNLGTLRSLGIIAYPAPGQVAATPLLFPELIGGTNG